MEDKIEINLNKNFVKLENITKLDKKFYEDHKGEEKDVDVFKSEVDYEVECHDISEGEILLGISGEFGHFFVNWEPKPSELLSLVEQQESISGDVLVKIVELVVKKLNKFKALLESIKGV